MTTTSKPTSDSSLKSQPWRDWCHKCVITLSGAGERQLTPLRQILHQQRTKSSSKKLFWTSPTSYQRLSRRRLWRNTKQTRWHGTKQSMHRHWTRAFGWWKSPGLLLNVIVNKFVTLRFVFAHRKFHRSKTVQRKRSPRWMELTLATFHRKLSQAFHSQQVRPFSEPSRQRLKASKHVKVFVKTTDTKRIVVVNDKNDKNSWWSLREACPDTFTTRWWCDKNTRS